MRYALIFLALLATPALAKQGGPNHGGHPYHDSGPPTWGKIGQDRQHESGSYGGCTGYNGCH